MNETNETLIAIVLCGLIAQLLVYGAYWFLGNLTLFVSFVVFVIYILIVISLHLFGAYLKKILS